MAGWIEHADLGRVTIGRHDMPGVYQMIDLTGHLGLPAGASFLTLSGGYFLRGTAGPVLQHDLEQHR